MKNKKQKQSHSKKQSPIKLVPGGNYVSDEDDYDGFYEGDYNDLYGGPDFMSQIIVGLHPKKRNFRVGKGRKRF